MKEAGFQDRVCILSAGVFVGLGMAGMGLASDSVVAADTASVTDTFSIIVQEVCSFNSVANRTYSGSATSGTEVSNFNDSGVHEFNVSCNNSNGYTVTATPYDLEATGINDVISYTNNYTHTGASGMWTAAIASTATGVTVTSPAPVGGGTIISSNSNTPAAGVTFTATYSAYVGTSTPAGTYTGTIVYTLAASGTPSNNSNTNNETPNNSNSGTDNSTESNNTPLAVNDTYNTMNYNSGGASTTGTQSTAGGSTNGTTSNATSESDDTNDSSNTSNSYEQPLGVKADTTSSGDDSEINWTPVAVATGALAATGVAVAALVRRNNEEDEEE